MNNVFLSIEDIYAALHNGEFDEPLTLARALDRLSNAAWDEVEELYQSSLLIR